MELGLIYWPKSTIRSRLTALFNPPLGWAAFQQSYWKSMFQLTQGSIKRTDLACLGPAEGHRQHHENRADASADD